MSPKEMRMISSQPAAPLATRPIVVFDHVASESEPHAGTWMIWPGNSETPWLATSSSVGSCTTVAAAIAGFEPVTVCASASQMEVARGMLDPAVRVAEMRYTHRWARRVGPAFFVHASGEARIFNWRVNAWGILQSTVDAPWNFEEAEAVSAAAIDCEPAAPGSPPLEGASLRSDGAGTLFISEDILAAAKHGQHDIEACLATCLGAQRIVWLPAGLKRRGYGGQLDNLMAPVRPGLVALAWTDDQSDPRRSIVRAAHARLSNTLDARGRRLEIVKLPLPAQDGHSYVNHYACNRGVIVPQFGDPCDLAALDVIRDLYPDREVVAIPSRHWKDCARLLQWDSMSA